MREKIKIKLYIGAHKTATTHLQGILMANRAVLLENKIKLSAPRNVRKGPLPSFLKSCNKNYFTKFKNILDMAPKKGTWILTDENIAGVSNDFIKLSGIYPNVGKRLQCIKKAFFNSDIELFFSIRSYEAFYRSAYVEVVRNRGYIPFSEFYNEERYKNNSWVEVIKMFVNVLPEENVTLWCYEDFRELLPSLLKEITELNDIENLIANYKSKTTRPSLSQKTIDILELLSPVISQKESCKLIECINKQYAIGDGNTALNPFTEEQISCFKKQYQEDIKIIKSEFPNINFLGLKK